MPLTIAEADPVKGTITLVVQKVGLSSTRLCELNVGDEVTIRHATGEGSILKAYSIERGTSGTEA